MKRATRCARRGLKDRGLLFLNIRLKETNIGDEERTFWLYRHRDPREDSCETRVFVIFLHVCPGKCKRFIRNPAIVIRPYHYSSFKPDMFVDDVEECESLEG